MKSFKKVFAIPSTVATLCFGGIAYASPIQWEVSAGGNGHYYELVKTAIFWDKAKADAESRIYGGVHGYLASITSQAENTFLASTFAPEAALGPEVFVFLGGYQPPGSPEPAGGWSWVNGEPWNYSNWASDSPNNCMPSGCRPENELAFVVSSRLGTAIGLWGDVDGVDPTDPNSHRAYYIVEFNSAIPEPATIALTIIGLAGIGFGARRGLLARTGSPL